ncbi:hypothetical protein [Streptomyces incanus]|uniref:Uncharacterized protein n=1 Tax=Streptomyces incanus TaxID=887453 RepID=A0ABW0XJ58_9ACTN
MSYSGTKATEVDQAHVTLFPVFGALPLLFGVEAEERGGRGAADEPVP